MNFGLPFPTYFILETKSDFSITRAEKGVKDNFSNKHPILIKLDTKKLSGILALKEQGVFK